ncbi:MAG: hypothetical protein JF603_06675 [Acidobacteria bacterium]|nr:hypothetical protein [Acidobacteriota bacterium]
MSTEGGCPCGQPLQYEQCCGLLHAGRKRAMTAEQLMRARYSAFALGHRQFLAESWHSTTLPTDVRLDPAQEWISLEVLATGRGGMLDHDGTVEFEAHWRRGGRHGVLHEVSRFVRESGSWVYLGPLT